MNVGAIMVDVPDLFAFDVISEKIHLLYMRYHKMHNLVDWLSQSIVDCSVVSLMCCTAYMRNSEYVS